MIAKSIAGALLLLGACGVQAVCPSVPTVDRFKIDGAEVTDYKTGLVWARCRVGQTWDGSTCTGVPTLVRHEPALALAQATSGWRLPHVKELSSLLDHGCENPAIDSTAFPGLAVKSAPGDAKGSITAVSANEYWSATPDVTNQWFAWHVAFYRASTSSFARTSYFAVRLVRDSP